MIEISKSLFLIYEWDNEAYKIIHRCPKENKCGEVIERSEGGDLGYWCNNCGYIPTKEEAILLKIKGLRV